MNIRQKFSLWLGIVAFVGLGLYPPWIEWYGIGYRPMGHSYLSKPPSEVREKKGMFGSIEKETKTANCIDVFALIIEWSMVGVVTKGLILTFKESEKQKDPSSST